MNLLNELMTDMGRVTGFGRVKIPKMPNLGFNYEIPLLSFVAIEMKNNGGYVATCIHLQIDGYGNTEDDAINDMKSNIWQFLSESFRDSSCADYAWDNILDAFKSNPRSNVLWDKYHALQIYFAKEGISTDHDAKLNEKIELLKIRVRELEQQIKELKTDNVKDRSMYIWERIKDVVEVQREKTSKKAA